MRSAVSVECEPRRKQLTTHPATTRFITSDNTLQQVMVHRNHSLAYSAQYLSILSRNLSLAAVQSPGIKQVAYLWDVCINSSYLLFSIALKVLILNKQQLKCQRGFLTRLSSFLKLTKRVYVSESPDFWVNALHKRDSTNFRITLQWSQYLLANT